VFYVHLEAIVDLEAQPLFLAWQVHIVQQEVRLHLIAHRVILVLPTAQLQ
jgi:hypothetical protein